MKFLDRIIEKQKNPNTHPLTIAFIGDSVTQGCFECYIDRNDKIETVFDYKSSYSTRLREKLNLIFPKIEFNIINSGISGDKAIRGYNRIVEDVIKYSPDLVVVAYGLNDANQGSDYLDFFKNGLTGMFKVLKDSNIETLYLTPNMMCEYARSLLRDKQLIDCANHAAEVQNSGLLDKFVDEAKIICGEYNVEYIDIYSNWKRLNSYGVDTTILLANYINHPIREMQEYIAQKIFEKILDI